mmetsp:Transcript_13656/g.31461  ORF Transcript_13656/g.31461 Transcript_13656/m.31461 type:complete len:588 (-) Transcript_13656:2-1765(-)
MEPAAALVDVPEDDLRDLQRLPVQAHPCLREELLEVLMQRLRCLCGSLVELHVGDDEQVRDVVSAQALSTHQLEHELHRLVDVRAHLEVRLSDVPHLVHEARALAQLVPCGLRREREDAVPVGGGRHLGAEDPQGDGDVHGDAHHGARDVAHGDGLAEVHRPRRPRLERLVLECLLHDGEHLRDLLGALVGRLDGESVLEVSRSPLELGLPLLDHLLHSLSDLPPHALVHLALALRQVFAGGPHLLHEVVRKELLAVELVGAGGFQERFPACQPRSILRARLRGISRALVEKRLHVSLHGQGWHSAEVDTVPRVGAHLGLAHLQRSSQLGKDLAVLSFHIPSCFLWLLARAQDLPVHLPADAAHRMQLSVEGMAFSGCVLGAEGEPRLSLLLLGKQQLLVVLLQLGCKQGPNSISKLVKAHFPHVGCSAPLEQKQEILPIPKLGHQLQKLQNNVWKLLIQHPRHHKEKCPLPLSSSAPTSLEGQDEERLDRFTVLISPRLGDHLLHQRADLLLSHAPHQTHQQPQQRLPEGLARDLPMLVISSRESIGDRGHGWWRWGQVLEEDRGQLAGREGGRGWSVGGERRGGR